jgi:hypothetical protein
VNEQDEILREFLTLLMGPTKDGARKRAAGRKPHWKVDHSHIEAMYRHLRRWETGETEDPDSGCHPLVHAAWRCLAVAWQETHTDGRS